MKLPADTLDALKNLAANARGDVSPVRLRAIASSLETVADMIRLAVIIETTPDPPPLKNPREP